METMNHGTRPQLLGLLAGLFLASGLVLSAFLITRAWMRIAESQAIVVTGSARKDVRADFVIWRGSVTTEAGTLVAAQRALRADLDRVIAFSQANQITNQLVSPINIQEVRSTEKLPDGTVQQKTVGYRLTQTVEIHSSDVDRIAQLDRDSSKLVEQGILFTPAPLEFIYTHAGEAKVEMLAEATRDARARAEQIAVQGGRAIHQLRSAKMGVFQITPIHSIQTSAEGMNDTTTLDKTIRAVVTASFSMN